LAGDRRHAEVTRWVRGGDHGVSLLDVDRRAWRHFSQADGLPGQAVLTFARSDENTLWAGTSDGIASFSNGQWKSHRQYARDDFNLAAATDSQGMTWFGTYRNGVLGLGQGGRRHFSSANSPLPHEMVSSLACGADGHLWVGTANGLALFDGESWQHFHRETSGLPSNRIERLLVDDAGHLWIGTDVSLARYHRKM
jgi:ligand-binding sensor domain-containing protein